MTSFASSWAKVPFVVEIEKNKTVGELKDLVKGECSNTFADIDSNFLDLYHMYITDGDEEDLIATVKA